jgi:hypothetical protein
MGFGAGDGVVVEFCEESVGVRERIRTRGSRVRLSFMRVSVEEI